MRRGLLACACVSSLASAVLAPTAGATDVTLKKGDIVLVRGTNLLCLFDSEKLIASENTDIPISFA